LLLHFLRGAGFDLLLHPGRAFGIGEVRELSAALRRRLLERQRGGRNAPNHYR
jgi:hypothetical protein